MNKITWTAELFRARLHVDEHGCWLWTGHVQDNGYGGITFNRKPTRTHRVSWILHNGPIPDGLCVLHKCDVRHCCNPDHLYLGTYADNNKDAWERLRQPTRTKLKLDVAQVKEIKSLLGTVSQKELRERFGVSPSAISSIAVGRSWSWV
jgi:hypothetical protein